MLRPGGVFAGSDSQPTLPFRLLHLGDTMNVVGPQDLGERLTVAGFDKAVVERDHRGHRFRCRAHKRLRAGKGAARASW